MATCTTSFCTCRGKILSEPERWGLVFAFVAVFAALSFSLWQGKDDLLPWLVAAGLAVAGEHLLPGKLYIAWGHRRRHDRSGPGNTANPKA